MKINRTKDLPHALKNINEIISKLENKIPSLFLDYDGTLTPIVSDPEKAILSEKNKKSIIKLAQIIQVAVISGRDRANVASKIGLENLIYAGSHGYDITGPNGLDMQYGPGQETLPLLDKAEENLKRVLAEIPGAMVERKKYAIAVHYRNVEDSKVEVVQSIVNKELGKYNSLKEGLGKKIIELKPDLDWHKGKALNWILEKLDLHSQKYIPIFIGDDVTDEDALEVLKDDGIGIIVGNHDETTYANYILDNTDEVSEFLEQLADHLS
ncbi:trehalose-phosphatase [Anditalea andensis]|uniref:Trehalose 6-phosphate phosphatase n=1 Tax=Anditalea andensis TaxID=1048983 RepID=A0A074L0P8_9BACT|nr:trehalose-phosphatase [Anditalea andensis]KEO74040.1 trehalose phosphatase [Anditalea andensis]